MTHFFPPTQRATCVALVVQQRVGPGVYSGPEGSQDYQSCFSVCHPRWYVVNRTHPRIRNILCHSCTLVFEKRELACLVVVANFVLPFLQQKQFFECLVVSLVGSIGAVACYGSSAPPSSQVLANLDAY